MRGRRDWLDAHHSARYISIMLRLASSRLMLVGWLAVFLSLSTAGDFVVDLVFEEPDLVSEASVEIPEGLLDPAEHLLVTSAGFAAWSSDASTVLPLVEWFGDGALLHAVLSSQFPVIPLSHSPPQQASGSFSIPLRI